jgi:integrase/recombinase XerD
MSPNDLFSQTNQTIDPGKQPQPVGQLPQSITAQSKITAGYAPYRTFLEQQGKSLNTIKAFLGDIRLLQRYFAEKNSNPAVGEITTDMLNAFMHWLCFERKNEKTGEIMGCKPKTYARRVTSIKSFFGWLSEVEIINTNPAAGVVQRSARAPLPRILTDAELERLLNTARDMLWSPRKPDARPYLLVSLLLQTGIKKSEAMKLALSDIDLSNPREPVIMIRYSDPRYAHKERKLYMLPDFAPVYKQYLRKYNPTEYLFECSPRNLEYVLSDLARAADLDPSRVSFEILRWTSAVRAYRFNTHPDALRQKMGLSPISWRETLEKIKKLASPGL